MEFLLDVLANLKLEKGAEAVIDVVKSWDKSQFEDFFPEHHKQSEETIICTLMSRDLPEIVDLRKSQNVQARKDMLCRTIHKAIAEDSPVKDIIDEIKEDIKNESAIQEQDVVTMASEKQLIRNV